MKMDEIPRAVSVYGAAHADAVARVANAAGTPVLLLSAAGAAASMGPGWFLALVKQTQERFPAAEIHAALDCEDYAGYALAALREGVKIVIYNGPAFDAVSDIAHQLDALVLRARPESLDARSAEATGSLDDAVKHALSFVGATNT